MCTNGLVPFKSQTFLCSHKSKAEASSNCILVSAEPIVKYIPRHVLSALSSSILLCLLSICKFLHPNRTFVLLGKRDFFVAVEQTIWRLFISHAVKHLYKAPPAVLYIINPVQTQELKLKNHPYRETMTSSLQSLPSDTGRL